MNDGSPQDWEVVRHPTARRIRLWIDPASGRVRLVLPRRAALKPALAWAEGKRGWIADRRASLPRPIPYAPGLTLTLADEPLTIVREEGRRRTLVREGDRLCVAGPADTLPRRVEAWLKRQALHLLTQDTTEFAGRAGVTIASVKVGDARGRWGSCASSGVIRYNWRLLLAPGWVRRATVAHEVAHRVHMNHGPAFHALVATLLGADPGAARAWLRTHGAALHWIGRSSA